MIWSDKYDGSKASRVVRTQIAKSLERRGFKPMKCNNPESDEKRRRNDVLKSRPIVSENDNELRRNKRELEDIKDTLRDICRASGKRLIGERCR